jgi:beta-glucosidase
VSVRVTNTGSRTGEAVVQLYVGFPTTTGEPPNQLKGFEKVALKPGKRKRVKMILDSSSFATWNTDAHVWSVALGQYTLRVGTSSRDLGAQTVVVLK